MRIVVIGGSGLIGSMLVKKLRQAGHDPLAASPNSGVDTLTGEGLAEALDEAKVVVDLSNAPDWDEAAVMDFFLTSSRNILAAETVAGVGHHVALSVVGADRLEDSGYLRAKHAQEEAVKAATVPYTIVARRSSSSSSARSPIRAPTERRFVCPPRSSSPRPPMMSPPRWPTSQRVTVERNRGAGRP